MRVALYARNSKPPKWWKPSTPGEEPPGSWKVQLAALRRWAEKEDHEVALEEHDVVTGEDPNRPGWERVAAAARGHHVHAVAAIKVDRVMRSAVHFYAVVKEFQDLDVDLYFVEQGTKLSKKDPMAKLLVGILALVAELELDLIKERTAAVMRLGEDGRTYGPRSERPAGRPTEYGPEHKFRLRRDGAREHDRARCRVCRGEKEGPAAQREPGPVADGGG